MSSQVKSSDTPDAIWQKIKVNQKVKNLTPLPLDTPIYPDKVRFVCMSDTHSNAEAFKDRIPNGDVFIHTGDFTYTGQVAEVEKFNKFLGTLPHHHKIVIAGNHELTFDERILPMTGPIEEGLHLSKKKLEFSREYLKQKNLSHMSQLLTNCTFLFDTETTVYGLRVYGSPWQPEFHHWAFNEKRGDDILRKWDLIPVGIDVLMTHGPALGRGDWCQGKWHEGCFDLLNTIQGRVRPKFHICGHIHEGRDQDGYSTDGVTTFINASNVDMRYNPVNPPIIFDIPLPPGISKDGSL